MKRRVVLISSCDLLSNIACAGLFDDSEGVEFEVVALVKSRLSLIKAIRILYKAICARSFFYITYMFLETSGLSVVNYFLKISRKRSGAGYAKSAVDIAKDKKVGVLKFSNLNSQDAIDKIKSYNPDLVLCVRVSEIFKNNFIRSFPIILNLHCALLPRYRGVGCVFQALAHSEKELGCTINMIDSEKIDSGSIVVQGKLPVEDSWSLLNCTIRLHKQAQGLMPQAINADEIRDNATAEKGSYFDWPGNKELNMFLSTKRKLFSISDFDFADLLQKGHTDEA